MWTFIKNAGHIVGAIYAVQAALWLMVGVLIGVFVRR
jgi:hypothetical protein